MNLEGQTAAYTNLETFAISNELLDWRAAASLSPCACVASDEVKKFR